MSRKKGRAPKVPCVLQRPLCVCDNAAAGRQAAGRGGGGARAATLPGSRAASVRERDQEKKMRHEGVQKGGVQEGG